jgi:5-methylcytosine-specific restriction endonuclease McrA
MSSLGKGYTDTSNQVGKGNLKPVREKDNQEGPTETGRSRPYLGQSRDGNLTSTLTDKVGSGQRGNQATRQAISITLRKQVFKRDHYQCRFCESSFLTDKKVKLEVDHIVPVSRGGTNDPHNLQILCRNCNQLKSASLV